MSGSITYYRCRFTQTSPIRLSNGANDSTDSDLMLDGRGLPMIPGTSIAGVLRSMLPQDECTIGLFGDKREDVASIGGKHPSRVIFSDAVLPAKAEVRKTTRDGVGIDDNGTAKAGAKYNFQIAETQEAYTSVIELSHAENDPAADRLEELLRSIVRNGISFGARTTRGYGRMKAEIVKKSFDLPNDLPAWLSFDPFADGAFDCSDVTAVEGIPGNAPGSRFRAGFELDGSFSVRVYSSNIGKADFAPLVNSAGRPVIPGTSWAGVFRHHMKKLAKETGRPDLEAGIDELFGAQEGTIKRSQISFAETEIFDGLPVTTTRTALDRFTMAPRDGALFKSVIWNGGNGIIEIRTAHELPGELRSLLLACFADLGDGLLTFGGAASIGLGRAKLKWLEVDGAAVEGFGGADRQEVQKNG